MSKGEKLFFKKSEIINWIFGVVLVLTTLFFIVLYIMICREMMNEEGAEDIRVKLPLAFMWIPFFLIGTPLYLVELDLFHTVKYFVKEKKYRQWGKTVINVISTIISLKILSDTVLFFIQLENANEKIYSIWILCFYNYIVLKAVYLLVHLIGGFIERIVYRKKIM